MTCGEITALLALAPLTGTGGRDDDEPALSADEATRLDEHLTGCEACREVAAALTKAYAGLGEDTERRTTMDPTTTDLRERTLSAIRATLAHDAEPAQKKGPAAAPEPGPDPRAVDAIGKKIALACSYCHDRATRDEVVFCASCLAPHHRECFETHGRCTLPGCGETRTVRPADAPQAPAKRTSRWLLATVFAGALGAGGIAALALAPPRPSISPSPPPQVPVLSPTPISALPPPPPDAELLPPPLLDDSETPPLPDDLVFTDDTETLPAPDGSERDTKPTGTFEVGLSAEATPTVDVLNIDVDQVDLADVMERIGRQAGRNVLVDPSVRETVSISLNGIPWRDAVDVIARMCQCEVEERPGGILLLTQPPKVTIQFTDANVRTILQLLAAYSGKNLILAPDVRGTLSVNFDQLDWWRALEIVAENRKLHLVRCRGDAVIVTAKPLDPAILAGLPLLVAPNDGDSGPKVWLEAENADLVDVTDQLGRVVGRNILVDPSVNERLTFSLRGVQLRHALDVVARVTGCQLEERAGGILLFTKAPRARLQAADCPATAWFQLLAGVGGFGTILDGSGLSGVTVDLSWVDYETAARLTAAPLGLAVKAPNGGSNRMLSFINTVVPTGETVVRDPRPVDEQELRLGGLITDVARLARAANAASGAERARLTKELEGRQAELRAVLSPAGPRRTTPDLITAAMGALSNVKQALTDQDPVRADAAMRELLEAIEECGRLMPSDVTEGLRALGEAGKASELRIRGEQADRDLAALDAAVKAERWSEARAARERLDALVSLLRERSTEEPVAALVKRIELVTTRVREEERVRDLLATRGRVQAILRSDEVEVAVINGRTYRAGDALLDENGDVPDGAPMTVRKIDDGAVTLELGGVTFTRELGSD